MERKPASGGRHGEAAADATADERDEAAGARRGKERFGPLEIERLRKEDGRALLHFTREPPYP